jgi:long-chain acyl-CoA synthetase
MGSVKPWLRHYPQEVAPTYEYPKHNLARLLIDSAERFPQYAAVYFMGKILSYEQLLKASYRFANGLLTLGIQKGDRVAIMLPNCPSAIIAYFGVLMMGAVVVQTNPLYMERELEYQLRDSGAIVMITLDLLFDRVNKVKPQTDLKYVVVTSIKDYLPFPKNILYPIKVKKDGIKLDITYGNRVISFKGLLASSSPAPICAEVHAQEDLDLLQYTGGLRDSLKAAC